jgi:hypothetical protein
LRIKNVQPANVNGQIFGRTGYHPFRLITKGLIVKRLPDFIIIGAMKCATSTLHDQLAAQSGIFMSAPKEPNFFSDDAQWSKGMQWYSSLFQSAKKYDICGESSTHYTKLPDYPKTLERMHRHLSNVKLIYVMRHPLDRLISQYMHEWTERTINLPIEMAVERHSRLVEYGLYSVQLKAYMDVYDKDNILPVFTERLMTCPEIELQRVCDFLGYEGRVEWKKNIQNRNISSDRLRKNELRDALVSIPAVTWVRTKIVPQSVRNWIKSFWQIKKRPVLGSDTQAVLKDAFDKDLAVLGQWLKTGLDCENFKSVVSENSLNWSSHTNNACSVEKIVEA